MTNVLRDDALLYCKVKIAAYVHGLEKRPETPDDLPLIEKPASGKGSWLGRD